MPSMQRLREILEEELRLYHRYLELLRADKDSMLNLKLEALEQSNKEKSTIVLKLQIADSSRRENLRRLARERLKGAEAVDIESITLRELVKSSNPIEREAMMNLRNRLEETVQQVRVATEENKLFANSSLRWMNTSLNHLKSFIAPTIYSQRGKVMQGVLQGNIVERSV